MSSPGDRDSAYGGEGCGGSTTSLASSVLEPVEKHGRAYHRFCSEIYPFPNDEEERDRLDFEHEIFLRRLDRRLCSAPVPPTLQRVLDLGTGTGIWAIEFADEYPSASVTGADLSAMQPGWVPPNCWFEIWDVSNPWTDSPNSIDYVHCRQLYGVEEKLPFRESFRALVPGGWLEVIQMALPLVSDDGSLRKEMALSRWQDKMIEASKLFGISFDNPPHYEQWMKEADFVNVREEVYRLPIGEWDEEWRELGIYQRENLVDGLDGLSKVLFIDVLRWTPVELEVFLARVRKDIRNPTIHAYAKLFVVYGQKPKAVD
jgi:SAM-dependent methyltransferase